MVTLYEVFLPAVESTEYTFLQGYVSKAKVTYVIHDVLWTNGLIPSKDHELVHLRYIPEGSTTVLYNLEVIEVMIANSVGSQISKALDRALLKFLIN